MRRIQAMLSLSVLILFLIVPQQASAQDDVAVSWLLGQINCLRQSLGSAPLTVNASLTISANRQSNNLSNDALTDFHVGLDGSTPTTRAQDAGFTGSVGENVASGLTVQDVFNWWMNSPVHYSNMTNAHWKEIGIGVGHGPHGTWYTLDFGAMNWSVEPFTASPCNGLSQPLPVLIQSTGAQLSSIEIVDTPTDVPPTPTVTGVDEHGYIKHVIQAGETPGRVILMYGYAWEDLPRLMALNNMTEADARRLNVGDIFLIPPREGMLALTPVTDDGIVPTIVSDTPSPLPSTTPLPSVTPIPSTLTPIPPSATMLPSLTSIPPTLTPIPPSLISTATTASSDILPTVALLSTQTDILPTAVASPIPTETLVPPAAFVASPTPEASPVTDGPSTDHSSILLAVVVVQQIVIFGMIAVWGIRRWRDSL